MKNSFSHLHLEALLSGGPLPRWLGLVSECLF